MRVKRYEKKWFKNQKLTGKDVKMQRCKKKKEREKV